MSIRSCARHNGMTGAGSDRDAGPTPVQRARFRELSSRKRQRVRIYWRRLERTRVAHLGRQRRAIGMWSRRQTSPPSSRSAASINCFPSHPGENARMFDVLPGMGSPEDRSCRCVRHGIRRTHRPAAGLQGSASHYNARRVD